MVWCDIVGFNEDGSNSRGLKILNDRTLASLTAHLKQPDITSIDECNLGQSRCRNLCVMYKLSGIKLVSLKNIHAYYLAFRYQGFKFD